MKRPVHRSRPQFLRLRPQRATPQGPKARRPPLSRPRPSPWSSRLSPKPCQRLDPCHPQWERDTGCRTRRTLYRVCRAMPLIRGRPTWKCRCVLSRLPRPQAGTARDQSLPNQAASCFCQPRVRLRSQGVRPRPSLPSRCRLPGTCDPPGPRRRRRPPTPAGHQWSVLAARTSARRALPAPCRARRRRPLRGAEVQLPLRRYGSAYRIARRGSPTHRHPLAQASARTKARRPHRHHRPPPRNPRQAPDGSRQRRPSSPTPHCSAYGRAGRRPNRHPFLPRHHGCLPRPSTNLARAWCSPWTLRSGGWWFA
jgi:hypothetical protein